MAADPPDTHDWYEKNRRSSPHEPNNAVLVERLQFMRDDLRRIENKIDSFEDKIIRVERDIAARYITQDEFLPVKLIAYGFVATVLLGFLGLLIHTIGWQP